jgi:glutamate carboxypeptidase
MTVLAAELRPLLEARTEPALATLEALVRTNSFTRNRDGGRRVAELLAEEARAVRGLAVRLVESERFAPHLVLSTARAEASAEGAIAIVGHLDTVFPPGTFEGFSVEGEGPLARVHGPGVLDMKGGLVMALEALGALSALGALDRVAARFVIVSDEEIGSPEGQEVLRRELAGASAALVLEAGRASDAIITRRKGTGSVAARAHGRAAHAGSAHASGSNAIWALARFVDRAQGLTDYARGVTVNVGTIRGGHAKNTVPDEAHAEVDFRFAGAHDGDDVLGALGDAAREAARSIDGTRVELHGGVSRFPLEATTASHALLHEYGACARAAGLGSVEAPLIGGGSDASTTHGMGIPSIDGLGPRGTGFHTKEERFELVTWMPKAEALARFLLGRARGEHAGSGASPPR